MSRAEFSKQTKRDALSRAGGKCEAVGEWYGLQPGQRCFGALAYGFHYDHIILEANSHDNSLSNCAVVCKPCHGVKTAKRDIPLAAKTVRQFDKANNIRGNSLGAMPCGRNSKWKKKMNGEVVRR